MPIQKFNKFSDKNHQGVFAKIALVKTKTIEELTEDLDITENPTLLLLDAVNDVRNFGAIARTASCTGVKGIIILDKGAAPISADAIKTSAGALFKIPVCKVNHLKDAIYYLQGSGFQIVLEDQVSYYKWQDIFTVFGYKKDLYSVDLICLDAFNENGKGFSINEETEGWFQFLRQLKRKITGIPEYWEIEIADPAFETNLTLLFDRQNRSFEALATEFYNERF